jgi:methyltransferase (TIGR00027 family)
VDHGTPSRTALTVAVQRAIHQLVDEEPKILVDPLAGRLVEAAAPGVLAQALERAELPRWRRGRAQWVVRSRFAEDELAARAPQSIQQYVILGAGLDTFAYRQPAWAAGLRIFEVDEPATQAWKRAALAGASIPVPTNLSWVPVDFEHDALEECLAAAGFDRARPAFVSWLGVTQYLTRPAIDETFRFVAGLPALSTIVLTFVLADDALPEEVRARKREAIALFGAQGEPWLTFFNPDELRAHLRELGFARVVHFTPEQADARYFAGRSDGMRAEPATHLMCATV